MPDIEYIRRLADNEAGMKLKSTSWFRSLAGALAFMAAVIFLAAGRLDYWQGWVFLGLTAASSGDDGRHPQERTPASSPNGPARARG